MLFEGTFRELRVSFMNVAHLACNENHGPFGEVGRAPASTHHCRNRSHELVSSTSLSRELTLRITWICFKCLSMNNNLGQIGVATGPSSRPSWCPTMLKPSHVWWL
jgi:hypothetical protein